MPSEISVNKNSFMLAEFRLPFENKVLCRTLLTLIETLREKLLAELFNPNMSD